MSSCSVAGVTTFLGQVSTEQFQFVGVSIADRLLLSRSVVAGSRSAPHAARWAVATRPTALDLRPTEADQGPRRLEFVEVEALAEARADLVERRVGLRRSAALPLKPDQAGRRAQREQRGTLLRGKGHGLGQEGLGLGVGPRTPQERFALYPIDLGKKRALPRGASVGNGLLQHGKGLVAGADLGQGLGELGPIP